MPDIPTQKPLSTLNQSFLAMLQHHSMCNGRYSHAFLTAKLTKECSGGYKKYPFPLTGF